MATLSRSYLFPLCMFVCFRGGGEEGGDDENKNEVSAKTAAVTSLYYAHDKGNVNEVMGGQ